jgi:hypothetical protein
VIEVADDQSLVTQIDKQMEQRDRITPAGNADKIALGWRKFGNKFGINVQGAVAPNKRSTAGPERKSNGSTATSRSPYGSRKKFQKTAAAWCITLLPVWRGSAEPGIFVGSTRVSPYQQACLAGRVQPIRRSAARLDHQSGTRGSTFGQIVSRDLEMVAVGIAKID